MLVSNPVVDFSCTELLEIAVSRFNLDRKRTLVIGDRLNSGPVSVGYFLMIAISSDIECGYRAKMPTMLVFSGVAQPKDLEEHNMKKHNYHMPDFIADSIADMVPAHDIDTIDRELAVHGYEAVISETQHRSRL